MRHIDWLGSLARLLRFGVVASVIPHLLSAATPVRRDSLETITTDTGAFSMGRAEFSTYKVPGLCLAAAQNEIGASRRSLDVQALMMTLRQFPERDTLAARVINVAKTCGKSFTVEGTAPRDLADLFDLALVSGNDTMADAVVRRQLTLAPNIGSKDSLLYAVVARYLSTEPARVSAAERIVAQLDQQLQSGIATKLAAHEQMMAFHLLTFNRAGVRKEARYILETARPLPVEKSDSVRPFVYYAYRHLAALAFVDSPDSLNAIAENVRRDLSRPCLICEKFIWRDSSNAAILRRLSPMGDYQDAAGKTIDPPNVAHWFPTRPAFPGAGGEAPVTLVLSTEAIGPGCLRDDIIILVFPSHQDRCTRLPNKVRQWTAQYGESLQIIVLAATGGHALRSLPLPPAEEARQIDWYFRDYLKLPVTVAVADAPIAREFPAPDGRRWYGIPQGDEAYLTQQVHLVGTHGDLLYGGPLSPVFDAMFARTMANVTVKSTTRAAQAEHP